MNVRMSLRLRAAPRRAAMFWPASLLLLLAAFVTATMLATAVSAAQTYRRLTGAEIKATLTGMEISDAHFSEQYMADGTVKIVNLGRRIVAKRIVKGDQLCVEAPEDSKCQEVWRSGNKFQIRIPGDPVPFDVEVQKQQARGW